MRVAIARPADARANTAFEGELRCYDRLVREHDIEIDVIARAGHSLETDRVRVVTCSQSRLERGRHMVRQGWCRLRQADRVVMPEFSALEAVLREKSYDVVEVPDPTLYPVAQTAVRACRRNGTPVAARASATKPLSGIVDHRTAQGTIDYASSFLFVSPMTHERFVDQGFIESEEDRAVYTGQPLDTALFSGRAETRDETGPVEFLSVGVLEERKGYKVLCRAFEGLNNARVPFRWRIVGTGELRDWIAEFAREHGFDDAITLLGEVPHGEIHSVYASADVFVLHSMETPTWEEYFGVAYAEAMSSALPVVGSDSGAIPWVVRDGIDGILVAEGDIDGVREGCTRLVDSASCRRELGRNGRRNVVDRFDIDAVGETFLEGWHLAADRR